MSEKKKFEFKTEVKQLLDLVIHSLYSHKDIFLRELISNAADAIDKVRFEALTNSALIEEGSADWKIKISADEKAKILTISDNGMGMTKEELIDNLGTIAKSGTKAFIEKIKSANEKTDLTLIGQFGVGFYSSFMVADKVEVISRHAASDKAYKWESTGEGGFEVTEDSKLTRGTDVVLYLKEEDLGYLKEYEIRGIVKKYSDFVEHAIVMDVEKEVKENPDDKKGKKEIVEETFNSRKALWTKSKSEVKEDEYKEFYKQIARDFQDPLKAIHYSAEGTIEFKALLFIPAKAPFDLYYPDAVKGIQLYVKRVFIMDDCKKLIPEYLRFLRGVVDSNDLPLNVSREILQQDAQLEKMKKNIINKVLSTLKTMLEKEYDEYLKFYKEFGKVLKEGTHYDYDNKNAILDLCLFESTKTAPGEYRTLKAYLEAMKADQKEIYYMLSESREAALASPHLEAFKKNDLEVLLLTDTIDEWLVNSVYEYEKKPLKAIDKGDIELPSDKEAKKGIESKQKEHKDLLEYIQTQLDADVKEVRFSSRLTDSISCLVSDDGAVTKQMEQMFKAMGQEVPHQKRILELNPDHEIIKILKNIYEINKDSSSLKDYCQLMYDQALLAEGGKLKDPLGFVKRVSELMVKAVK